MKFNISAVISLTLLASLSPAFAQVGDPGESLRPAKLMVLEEAADFVERRFFGRIAARSTVDLSFRAGGQIEELPIRQGQFVEAGTLLGRLDRGPFERAVNEAQVQLNQAERQLARLSELGAGVVALAEIENAQSTRDVAQVAYEDALDSLNYATMQAPFDALISQRLADQYATVAAGEPVVRAHDMSEIQVHIQVPEILFRQFGGQLEFQARAQMVIDGPLYPLEYRELTAEAAEAGQTYRVAFAFGEDQPEDLLPGASATVQVTVQRPGSDSVVTLPASALRYAPDGRPQVLVYRPDDADPNRGTLASRSVTIEPAGGTTFYMLEGPEPGVTIVASGAAMLADGTRVGRFTGLSNDHGPTHEASQ